MFTARDSSVRVRRIISWCVIIIAASGVIIACAIHWRSIRRSNDDALIVMTQEANGAFIANIARSCPPVCVCMISAILDEYIPQCGYALSRVQSQTTESDVISMVSDEWTRALIIEELVRSLQERLSGVPDRGSVAVSGGVITISRGNSDAVEKDSAEVTEEIHYQESGNSGRSYIIRNGYLYQVAVYRDCIIYANACDSIVAFAVFIRKGNDMAVGVLNLGGDSVVQMYSRLNDWKYTHELYMKVLFMFRDCIH